MKNNIYLFDSQMHALVNQKEEEANMCDIEMIFDMRMLICPLA